jgi:hypothetical protein
MAKSEEFELMKFEDTAGFSIRAGKLIASQPRGPRPRWRMDKQAVLIGEIILNLEPRITLYAETVIPLSPEGIAALKDKLVNLLDTRFHPSEPVSPAQRARPAPDGRSLTVEDAAALLHCRCRTVLKMVKRGELHPTSDEDGELYFNPEEIASVAHLPI